MFLINTFSITRLNNAEITGLLINIQKLISQSTAAAIGIDTTVNTAYNDALRLLVDQVYTTQGSQHTAAMQDADLKRDIIYKRIRLKLQTVEVAEDGSPLQKIADKVQAKLLSRYGAGVPQKPYHEETAILQGFLFDLHDKLDDDDVELLGIEGDITRLEQANNAFIEAYQLRAAEKAENETARTQKLRAELIDLYTQICIVLQYYANSTDDKATTCQEFIKNLNVILAEAKKRLDQRLNKTGATTEGDDPSEGDGGSDNAPTDGKDQGSNEPEKPQPQPNTGGSGNTSGNGSSGNGNVTEF